MPKTLSYKEVKEHIESKECKLLSESYKNNRSKLKYVCRCGHERESTLNTFNALVNYLCRNCAKNVNERRNCTEHPISENINKKKYDRLSDLFGKLFISSLNYRDDFEEENKEKTLKCRKCKEEKLLYLFPYRAHTPHKKDTMCRVCYIRQRQYKCDNYTHDQVIKKVIRVAKSSKKECRITFESVKNLLRSQDGRCAYSGVKLEFKFNNKYKISIDRIDSAKGYIDGNIQLLGWIVNQAKSNLSENQFFEMVKSINSPEPIPDNICVSDDKLKKIEKFVAYVWSHSKCSKVNKEHKFELTKVDILDVLRQQSYRCRYTNCELLYEKGELNKMSVDRVDSSKGYRKDNIQIVCWKVNQAKSDLSEEEFMKMMKHIFENRLKEPQKLT